MSDYFSNLPVSNQPPKKWYKTVWGIILIILGTLCSLGAILFLAFFSYYFWQLNFGDAEDINQLAKQYGNNISIDSSLASRVTTNAKQIVDYKKYIQSFNPTFGTDQPKVYIMAFVDFECPYCQKAYPDFKKMMEKYAPVAQVVFKNLPLASIHPHATLAAESAMCAGEQNKFWQYHDQLFERKNLQSESLYKLASDLGLNTNKFKNCLEQHTQRDNLEVDTRHSLDMGVVGTPTFFVNGYKFEGNLKLADWDEIILNFLN